MTPKPRHHQLFTRRILKELTATDDVNQFFDESLRESLQTAFMPDSLAGIIAKLGELHFRIDPQQWTQQRAILLTFSLAREINNNVEQQSPPSKMLSPDDYLLLDHDIWHSRYFKTSIRIKEKKVEIEGWEESGYFTRDWCRRQEGTSIHYYSDDGRMEVQSRVAITDCDDEDLGVDEIVRRWFEADGNRWPPVTMIRRTGVSGRGDIIRLNADRLPPPPEIVDVL